MTSTAFITRLPAVYIGTQRGFRSIPSLELYNLLAPLGEHPVGSTVSRGTLEKHGWQVLAARKRIGQRPRARPVLDFAADGGVAAATAA
jgi:hypothetical protein